MSIVYRVELGTNLYGHGISTFEQSGEAVTVEGTPMVRMSHGVIVKADGWFSDAAAARAAAADRIEKLAQTLLSQAASLKQQEVTA